MPEDGYRNDGSPSFELHVVFRGQNGETHDRLELLLTGSDCSNAVLCIGHVLFDFLGAALCCVYTIGVTSRKIIEVNEYNGFVFGSDHGSKYNILDSGRILPASEKEYDEWVKSHKDSNDKSK